jgi:CelD/BcsL family acetyltransferase involved in cellulose biosynthesis
VTAHRAERARWWRSRAYDRCINVIAPAQPATNTASAEPRTYVARTVEEVEALRPAWAQLEVENLDAEIDHFLTVVRHGPNVSRPHVVRIERPDRGDILIVARLEEGPFETRIGYRTVSRARMRVLRVSFGGVIGTETDADRRLAFEELQRPLRDGEADVVILAQLDVDGPLWGLARDAGSRLTTDVGQTRTAHWSVSIAGSIDDFLAARSKTTRKTVKRYDNRMERLHPDARVHTFADESQLEELCAEMERVAATTYQRTLGAGFSGDPLERALMALGMRRGWFRAWVLYFGDIPVAFWQGFAYRGVYATGCPGFDPEYTKDRVGAYLAVRMIEELCASGDVQTLDWGHGDADYKRQFGDTRREQADILFFARTPRAVRVRLTRAGAAGATRLAKRMLAGSGRAQRLKRAWRDRLARG